MSPCVVYRPHGLHVEEAYMDSYGRLACLFLLQQHRAAVILKGFLLLDEPPL